MNYELIFSSASLLAMCGWLLLLVSPWMPVWSDRLSGLAIPILLAMIYAVVIVFDPAYGGGFGTFAEITELFSNPQALIAGWVHFLIFDLVVGAWICRKARTEEIGFVFVLPCLPVTFLFGPAGFLLFSIVWGSTSMLQKRSLERP